MPQVWQRLKPKVGMVFDSIKEIFNLSVIYIIWRAWIQRFQLSYLDIENDSILVKDSIEIKGKEKNMPNAQFDAKYMMTIYIGWLNFVQCNWSHQRFVGGDKNIYGWSLCPIK